MNQEIKANWVKALRSGEYEQIQGTLHTDDGFCCLGVLCDLHAKEIGGIWDKVNPEDETLCYYNSTGILPDIVRQWAGLDTSDPILIKEGSKNHVSGLNDTGYEFEQIANLIEEQL